MFINLTLLNTLYAMQALQGLPLICIAVWLGFLIIKKRVITQKIKLGLLALFSCSVLFACVSWCLATYNYVHYERPAYQQDIRYNAQHH